jgi:putative peptide zinc metalloprotease protein
MNRLIISVTAFAFLVACCFLPLPAGISATATIVPANETPIYVSTTGTLDQLHRRPGDRVSQGDLIATLSNPDVELRRLQAEGRYVTQATIVDSIRQSAVNSPQAANELPGQQSLLDDLASRLQRRTSQSAGLNIKAPQSGRLIAGPFRNPNKNPNNQPRLVRWSGLATDDANLHCLLETGTELMTIAADDQWEAEILVDQSSVHRIRVGAEVKLVLESLPATAFFGTVTNVSKNRWVRQDRADRRNSTLAMQAADPTETYYLVRVELPSNIELPLTSGTMAAARIETQKLSLASRAVHAFNGLFRFR